MRYTQTAVGWRVTTDRNRAVTERLTGCAVAEQAAKANNCLILQVPEGAVSRALTDTDIRIKRDLELRNGPWNTTTHRLAVKLKRGCAIQIAGLNVGRAADLLPGREVEAEVTLAGAWPGGYVWQANLLRLGPAAGGVE